MSVSESAAPARVAVRAVVYEVCAQPPPGVDQRHLGVRVTERQRDAWAVTWPMLEGTGYGVTRDGQIRPEVAEALPLEEALGVAERTVAWLATLGDRAEMAPGLSQTGRELPGLDGGSP